MFCSHHHISSPKSAEVKKALADFGFKGKGNAASRQRKGALCSRCVGRRSRVDSGSLKIIAIVLEDAMSKLENFFESFLFSSRLVTLLAVLGALFSSVVMFIMGTMKIVNSVAKFWDQITGARDTESSGAVVALFVSSVDIYLFATVLLIFSNGLYELFIKGVDPAARYPGTRQNWLKVSSLDDLKSSLGKVILMILIVWFFEKALVIEYHTALDLLCLGVGVLLVALALYLTHGVKKSNAPCS